MNFISRTLVHCLASVQKNKSVKFDILKVTGLMECEDDGVAFLGQLFQSY